MSFLKKTYIRRIRANNLMRYKTCNVIDEICLGKRVR